MRLKTTLSFLAAILVFSFSLAYADSTPKELNGAYRSPKKNGWTYVHLQGSPHEIGFQNGYLLASEIQDLLQVVKLEQKHDSGKEWPFFRDAAQTMFWAHIEREYREELQGIADGATAHGVKIDVWDVIGINALTEWSYYTKEYDKEHGVKAAALGVPERCSAFVATGSYTKDGKVVIAHNNWSTYMEGERWTII